MSDCFVEVSEWANAWWNVHVCHDGLGSSKEIKSNDREEAQPLPFPDPHPWSGVMLDSSVTNLLESNCREI
jgi:hypothetical protein